MEENLPYTILDAPWHESITEDYNRAKNDSDRNDIFVAHGVDKAHLAAARRVAGLEAPPEVQETEADILRDIRSEARKANNDSPKTLIVAVLTLIVTAIALFSTTN